MKTNKMLGRWKSIKCMEGGKSSVGRALKEKAHRSRHDQGYQEERFYWVGYSQPHPHWRNCSLECLVWNSIQNQIQSNNHPGPTNPFVLELRLRISVRTAGETMCHSSRPFRTRYAPGIRSSRPNAWFIRLAVQSWRFSKTAGPG